MAKFKQQHLKLKDNQRVYFGTSDDKSAYFDGTNLIISGFNLENTITIDSTPTTSGVTGDITPMTMGAAVEFGNMLYVNADGELGISNADSEDTMPVFCMATSTVASGVEGLVLMQGFVNQPGDLTIGGKLYASTTSGAVTQTGPSDDGDQVQIIGKAVAGDRFHFNPSNDVGEV